MMPYQDPVPNLADLRRRVLRPPIAIEVSHDPRFARKPMSRSYTLAQRTLQLSTICPGLVPVSAARNRCRLSVGPPLSLSRSPKRRQSKQRAADSPVDSEDRRQCVATSRAVSSQPPAFCSSLVACHRVSLSRNASLSPRRGSRGCVAVAAATLHPPVPAVPASPVCEQRVPRRCERMKQASNC